jgi:hypothetical protein
MSQVLVDAGVGSAGVVLPTLTAGYDAAWLGWNEAWRENRQFTGVDAAQAMGMRAVRITAVFEDHPDEGPSGDAVISSYRELLPALGLA